MDGATLSSIGPGLLILLGIRKGDTEEQARQLARKVAKLRLWADLKDGSRQWASSVADNGFEVLVVSQFTLFATFKKPKPNYNRAMGGDAARQLYETFVEQCRAELGDAKVSTGSFGALMQVDLRNDGPVTVELVADPPEAAPALPGALADASSGSATAPSVSASALASQHGKRRSFSTAGCAVGLAGAQRWAVSPYPTRSAHRPYPRMPPAGAGGRAWSRWCLLVPAMAAGRQLCGWGKAEPLAPTPGHVRALRGLATRGVWTPPSFRRRVPFGVLGFWQHGLDAALPR